MASLTARVLKVILRSQMKKEFKDADSFVKHLRKIMDLSLPISLPSGVRKKVARIAGVPGEWLEVDNPELTIVFFHGGAFIGGQLATYNGFCGQLAKQLNARIFMADYRLAPEHKFPAAVDDCFLVYEDIQKNYSEQPIVVAGDSAGGNLTLVTLIKAKENDIPMPDCALALSPGTDLSEGVYSRQANAESDDMFDSCVFELMEEVYSPGVDLKNPYLSPAYGNFKGFPPLCFTVSETEALRDDAYKVAHKARAAGVPVKMITRPDMLHDWPVLYPLLKEAREDMPLLLEFIREHTPALLTHFDTGAITKNKKAVA